MNPLPQRLPLAAQAAAALREAIVAGEWKDRLPGEWELCEKLRVSRVTLRAALARLTEEGLVRSSQGRRREIAAPSRAPLRTVSDRVVFLTPVLLHAAPPFVMFWVDALRRSLGDAGFHLDVVHCPAGGAGRTDAFLEDAAARRRAAGWVLYLSTAAVQQWFSGRHIPAVIAGSRHEGAALPSVDLDHRAVCRHAAGRFLAKGHRRLALLNPGGGHAGDLESETGFLEAAARSGLDAAAAVVAHHDGTPEGVCARLDALLARSAPPTAFLVSRPMHALTAVTHLARRDRLPPRVSLIARDDDSFLGHVVPRVARYVASPAAFARKVSALVLEMARSGAAGPQDVRLMPAFVPGETLAPPTGM